MLRVFWTMEITDIGDEAIFSIATLLEWNALAVQVKLHHHLWINNHPSTPKSCTIWGSSARCLPSWGYSPFHTCPPLRKGSSHSGWMRMGQFSSCKHMGEEGQWSATVVGAASRHTELTSTQISQILSFSENIWLRKYFWNMRSNKSLWIDTIYNRGSSTCITMMDWLYSQWDNAWLSCSHTACKPAWNGSNCRQWTG